MRERTRDNFANSTRSRESSSRAPRWKLKNCECHPELPCPLPFPSAPAAKSYGRFYARARIKCRVRFYAGWRCKSPQLSLTVEAMKTMRIPEKGRGTRNFFASTQVPWPTYSIARALYCICACVSICALVSEKCTVHRENHKLYRRVKA